MVSVYDLSVLCESCQTAVEPARPSGERKIGAIGAGILGVFGLLYGLTVGIATAGFGMVAAPFTLLIGAYAGYKLGAWYSERRDGVTCPDCGHNFS